MHKKLSCNLLLCSIKVGRYFLPPFSAPSRNSALKYFRAIFDRFTKADCKRVTLFAVGVMHVKTGIVTPFAKPEKMEVHDVR